MQQLLFLQAQENSQAITPPVSRDCSYGLEIQKARLYRSGPPGHPVPHAEPCLYSLDPPLPQLFLLENQSIQDNSQGAAC